jgi:hypothetical protein
MLRLVYVSEATRDLDASDLEAIARASERNNQALGLTGLLLFGGGRFHAVLEGGNRRVLSRMETIITDPRHRAIRILSEEEIAAPRFANWSFGHVPGPSGPHDAPDDLTAFILGLAGGF